MKKEIILFFLLLGAGIVATGQRALAPPSLPAAYVKDSFPRLVEKAAKVLASAYMVQELVAITDTIPGWEGFPVHLYTYKTGIDIRTGRPKQAMVYLLNPSPEKLAMWVATTCRITKKSLSATYTDRVLDWVMHQSGGQFPVKGVVFEDQYVKGQQEPYLFKDGVTVYMEDTLHWPASGVLTIADQLFAIEVANSDLKMQTGQFARICSTTREDYLASGGRDTVGNKTDRQLSWLEVVRKLYQRAWNSDVNPLMVMWARRHL